MKGYIKSGNETKRGHGWITGNDGENYHFLIFYDMPQGGEPEVGDMVEFEPYDECYAKDVIITAKVPPGYIPPPPQKKVDDRIVCPKCGRRVVPRLDLYRGNPVKSLCPFCGTTIETFSQCFIATAVYGSGSCYEVSVLRNYRDEELLPKTLGRAFVKTYYALSPPIAKWLRGKPGLSAFIREKWLDPIVKKISE